MPPRKRHCRESRDDIVSRLPDQMLLEILSKLDMKYAVQTTILSKRWRDIWTSVRELQFDTQLFYSLTEGRLVGFTQFVNTILLSLKIDNKDHDIQRLCIISRDYEIETHDLLTWIMAVVRRNVHEIDLDICNRGIWLPRCLFTCDSLKKLILSVTNNNYNNERWSIPLPDSMGLPNLCVLKIYHIVFKNENLTNKFFLCCPNLEELTLSDVEFQFTNVNLYCPKLRVLTVDHGISAWPNIKFRLHAPCLLEDLKLPAWFFEAMSGSLLEGEPTELGALKCLRLEAWFSVDSFRAIAYLLKISPNIESLFLEIKPVLGNVTNCSEAAVHLQCLLDKLENIEIKGAVGCALELSLLKGILKNAKVLKKLVVYTSKCDKRVMEFTRKLLRLPRASSNLKIVVF